MEQIRRSLVARTNLSVDKIRSLATMDGVGYIDYVDESHVQALGNSMDISRTKDAQLDWKLNHPGSQMALESR